MESSLPLLAGGQLGERGMEQLRSLPLFLLILKHTDDPAGWN